MMMDYGIQRKNDVIRKVSQQLREIECVVDGENIAAALSYFERRTDIAAVKEKYIDRTAIGITKKEGEAGYEIYKKGRQAEMITDGEVEIITIGVGPRISAARATLFTNKTQSWDWLGDNEETEEETAEAIQAHRDAGGFAVQVANADSIATSVESGPLYIDYSGGHLSYRAFSPSCLYAKYADKITEIIDGKEVERGVDYRDIEDASCIVILLSQYRGDGQADPQLNSYLAIFGRSDVYPFGRRVQYTARDWRNIPDVDDDETAIEYRLSSGEPANPLSWLAAQPGDVQIPEYPICIFRGGMSKTDDRLVPTSTTLYESCLEIDVAMSRLMKDSLNSARGKDVVTNELGHELPRSLEGAVLLHQGQTLQIMGQPASNSQGAMDVAKDITRAVAEGNSVPGYMIMAEPGGNPEAGVALVIRTQPLIDDRENRITVNKDEVARMFAIERGLIQVFTGKEVGGPNTKQKWNPGRFIVPESETEKAARLKASLDAGFIDYVRAVRDYHMFPTDEDAKKFIEKMQERNDIKAPTASGAQRTGLPLGMPTRPAKNEPQKEEENNGDNAKDKPRNPFEARKN